jgi:hypothetical protein
MPLTIPKPLIPILIKPKVPGWLFVAALVAQYAIMATTGSTAPECQVKLENIHYSSSVKRNLGKHAIKLNAVTSCTTNQVYSKLQARIDVLEKEKASVIYQSVVTRIDADIKNPKEAEFLDFWTKCEKGSIRSYLGSVEGEVLLANGKTVPFSGSTKDFLPALCDFKAK